MRWRLLFVMTVAGCGSILTVPDQGITITGCSAPAQCFSTSCPCNFANLSSCTVAPVPIAGSTDPTAYCPTDGGTYQCLEPAQACVGRGPFCGGVGALCVHTSLDMATATEPPMLVPGPNATLEPHCPFTDDTCLPGTGQDGGVPHD
jgi:hypothetical protein